MTQTLSSLTLPTQFAPILSHRLNSMLQTPPVVLALGSDKHTTDCFGPLTGHYLKAMNLPTVVYGCLNDPLNALTLPNMYQLLQNKHKKSTVLALDSMIGNKSDIGKLKLCSSGLYPGSGIGKKFPLIGDISLTAIIIDKQSFLQKEPIGLGQVHKLAIAAAKIVYNAIVQLFNQTSFLHSLL